MRTAAKKVMILGGGKIGSVIARLLSATPDYQVTLGDANALALQKFERASGIPTRHLDCTDVADLRRCLSSHFAVISALPYHLTASVGRVAAELGVHYFDLTEDVASTRSIKALAETASSVLMPQCGLAPGFISIVAHDLAKGFDSLDAVELRVGALPQFPSNALKYNLTWSTEGLINEYCRPCEALVNGELTEVPPLEQLEHFSLDGVEYEAFNTSGGLGTLCETLAGKVNSLNYRSIRYPGHRDLMKVLLEDLKLADRQHLLKELFEHALPATQQDVIVVFATVKGWKLGRYLQESYANKIYAREYAGQWLSGIQLTTASGVCAVVDMVANGQLPDKGFVRQEQVSLQDFLDNRFGRNFMNTRSGSTPDQHSEVA